MATINYTVEENAVAGYVKVEWDGLSANDDGQVFDCSGLQIASVHLFGNLNSGRFSIMASNQLTPTAFVEIYDGNNERLAVSGSPVLGYVGAIKPLADGSIVNAGATVIFLVK